MLRTLNRPGQAQTVPCMICSVAPTMLCRKVLQAGLPATPPDGSKSESTSSRSSDLGSPA